MTTIESFSAQTGEKPQVLILGSIPGVASLQANEYYAHPRNAFWSIMAEYFQFELAAQYCDRLSSLLTSGVALWDVLAACERSGSLDSSIKSHTIIANDIDGWLAVQPTVKGIILNGGKAAQEFNKHFKKLNALASFQVINCPSTSPAYAAMTKAQKQQKWFVALDSILS